MKKRKKKTRAMKEANNDEINSKYSKKKRLRARGILSLTSPFKLVKDDNGNKE